MEPFTRVTGVLAPLDRADVDTDQIIPKQFLKRIERSGYGPFLFYDWRKSGDFILDRPAYRGASALVTGPNFGCGSSREHAPWSLLDAGFRTVIAPSFADIFKSNSVRCGLLAIELPEPVTRALIERALAEPGLSITVDLVESTISFDPLPLAGRDGEGVAIPFTPDPFSRECLLNGWDEVALTLRQAGVITRYEAARPGWLPRTR
ncbi:MAG: 3-isopropylmalate dehydratase small subunit [Candidatus Dormibacteraeota bacterium]|nr:3-isopropylmalate dehydratase small subunit [Candidatus Dormibacteraeota bacterium]